MPFKRYRTKRKPKLKRQQTKSEYLKAVAQQKTALINPSKDLCPFPSQYMCHFKYADSGTLTGTYTQDYVYSLTSAYDPNYTGTGSSPYGWVYLAAVYYQYAVVSADVKVIFYEELGETIGVGNIIVAVQADENSANGLTTIPEILEEKRVNHRFFDSSQQPHSTITYHYNAKKFHGLTNLKDNEDIWGIASGSSPTKDAFLHVFMHNPTVVSTSIKYAIQINYKVMFRDLIDLH